MGVISEARTLEQEAAAGKASCGACGAEDRENKWLAKAQYNKGKADR